MSIPAVADVLQEALALHRRGALAEAASGYAAVLRDDPANVDAHYYLGMLRCKESRFEEGAEHARRALAADPHHVRAHILLGRALSAVGKRDEALEQFDRAIALAPDLAEGHSYRADLLYDLGRNAEAVESYDQALVLAPKATENWFNRGMALISLGRHKEALESCNDVLGENPNHPDAYILRGAALLAGGPFEEALANYDQALKLNPDSAMAWIGRGNVLRKLDREEEAVGAYDKAISLQSDLPAETWFSRGDAFFSLKRYPEAMSAYAKAAVLRPDLLVERFGHDHASLFLSGRRACWAMPRGQPISNLSEIEFQVFSQNGEDGIIEWLVSHTDIPNTSFIEFGVGNFGEANSRFLLLNRNWRGFVMDSSEANMEELRDRPWFWKYDLTAQGAVVTAENINSLLSTAGFSGQLGILSIDIDGNDYWVRKAITVVSPAVVICEYNGTLGNTAPIAVPYKPDFDRFAAHYSGIYEGCSIAALKYLAQERGYTFVGTNLSGVNAFFVRNDLAKPVIDLLAEAKEFPLRKQGCRDHAGDIAYLRGLARFDLIKHLPVVDVRTGQTFTLDQIATLFTADWLAAIS
jgi:tetratricopeptide (TPR) repeat protein